MSGAVWQGPPCSVTIWMMSVFCFCSFCALLIFFFPLFLSLKLFSNFLLNNQLLLAVCTAQLWPKAANFPHQLLLLIR